jgi:hypothetical protein
LGEQAGQSNAPHLPKAPLPLRFVGAVQERSPLRRHFKIIRHFYLVGFETVNRFDLSGCGGSFKPAG